MYPVFLIAAFDRQLFSRYHKAVRRAGLEAAFLPKPAYALSAGVSFLPPLDISLDIPPFFLRFAHFHAENPGFCGLLLPGGGDLHPSLFHQTNQGSRHIDLSLDLLQLSLARAFLQAGKPILGICKGMQLINVLFGGDLIQDLPETRKRIHAWDETGQVDRIHPSWISSRFLPAGRLPAPDPCPDQKSNPESPKQTGAFTPSQKDSENWIPLSVNSAHHQALGQPGRHLTIIQRAPDGIAEGICHETLPVVGLQWHPERLDTPGCEAFFTDLLQRLIQKKPLLKNS